MKPLVPFTKIYSLKNLEKKKEKGKTGWVEVVIAALVFFSGSSHAASFDCAKASKSRPIEITICASSELSLLDEALDKEYKSALGKSNDAEIRDSQRKWLREVRNPCQTTDCLITAYKQRIAILTSATLPLPISPPIASSPVAASPHVTSPIVPPLAPATPPPVVTEKILGNIDKCDELAAHPDDPEKPEQVKGVSDETLELDPSKAVFVCVKAMAEEPDIPRLKFQLARAYLFTYAILEPLDLLFAAAESGHGAATAYLADLILYGAGGLESDPETAKILYLRAEEFGFKPAGMLAASIVENAVPEKNQENHESLPYKFPEFVKDMTAEKYPKSSHSYGMMLYYVSSAILGIKHKCPQIIPDRNWDNVFSHAMTQFVKYEEMIELVQRADAGKLDEFMQNGFDDGYAVAVNNDCNDVKTKNVVSAAMSYMGIN